MVTRINRLKRKMRYANESFYFHIGKYWILSNFGLFKILLESRMNKKTVIRWEKSECFLENLSSSNWRRIRINCYIKNKLNWRRKMMETMKKKCLRRHKRWRKKKKINVNTENRRDCPLKIIKTMKFYVFRLKTVICVSTMTFPKNRQCTEPTIEMVWISFTVIASLLSIQTIHRK